MRGLNPILMDGGIVSFPASTDDREVARREMGQTRVFADRIDLAHMVPHGELVSTGFCLADPGGEYLAYGSGGLDLTLVAGTYTVEWFSPDTEQLTTTDDVTAGNDGPMHFEPPFDGQVVLHLRLK